MKKHDTDALMEYLDGRLAGEAAARFEARLAADPALRTECDALRALRTLLSDRPPIPENPWFWQRLTARMETVATDAPEVPRRAFSLSPAMMSIAVLGMVALATVGYMQREHFGRLFSRGSKQVQQAYSDGFLKGWVMPLFQKTDRDEALTFAVLGTLPLDEQSSTVLRLDKGSMQGYRIELGSRESLPAPQLSAEELYRHLAARPDQRRTLDSLFAAAQQRIESSVLVGDNDAVAIHASLTGLHEDILVGVASMLDADQRGRFDSYLVMHGAGDVALMAAREPASSPSVMIQRIRTPMEQPAFVVLTPQGARLLRVGVNIDSLRDVMEAQPGRPDMSARFTTIAREYAVQSRMVRESPASPSPANPSSVDPSSVIAVEGEDHIELRLLSDPATAQRRVIVRVRPQLAPRTVSGIAAPEIGGSMQEGNQIFVTIDSSLQTVMEGIPNIDIRLPEVTLLYPGDPPPLPAGIGSADAQELRSLQDAFRRARDRYDASAQALARASRSGTLQRELLRAHRDHLREALRAQREYMRAIRSAAGGSGPSFIVPGGGEPPEHEEDEGQ